MSAGKAIETTYAGVRFRSRLEARWAVFFDALGIRWVHEPEAFILREGDGYLPDFWLPTFPQDKGILVEVKPRLERSAFEKTIRFVRDTGRHVWLVDGVPDYKVTHVIGWTPEAGRSEDDLWRHLQPVIPLADQAERENRFFSTPGYEDEAGYFDESYAGATYDAAIGRVRAHRFWEPRA